MAAQLGVKLQPLSWEKENWEGVQANVKHAFQILSNNTSKVQSWSTKIEERLKDHESSSEQLEQRATKAEEVMDSMENRLQELLAEVAGMKKQGAYEFEALHSCIQENLQATYSFNDNFIRIFNSSGVEDTLDLEHDTESEPVERLRALCQRVASQRPKALLTFDAWREWRSEINAKGEDLSSKSVALKWTSDDIWQRMMQWRTQLQESIHLLEHLGNGLATAQGDIRSLQQTRVAREDLEVVVFEKDADLTKLKSLTEQRLADVGKQIESKVSESDANVKNIERQLGEEVAEVNLNMKTLLEQSLNPISAYLNTMHVGAGTMRMEIDDLSTKLSSAQTRIQTVADQLQSCEDLGNQRETTLHGRLEVLAHETNEGVQKLLQAREDFNVSAKDMREQLGMQIQGLQDKLEGDSEAIESLRKSDLPKITREFLELEQKVAKWIRTETMPGKINEARLYALESRLAHEMESRLHLEEFTRERVVSQLSLVTNAVSNSVKLPMNAHASGQGLALPAVSRHTPRTEEGCFNVHKHVAKQAGARPVIRASPRSSMTGKRSDGADSLALELCLS